MTAQIPAVTRRRRSPAAAFNGTMLGLAFYPIKVRLEKWLRRVLPRDSQPVQVATS